MNIDAATKQALRCIISAVALTFMVGCATQGSETATNEPLSFHAKAIAGELDGTTDQATAEERVEGDDELAAAEEVSADDQPAEQTPEEQDQERAVATGDCNKEIITMSEGAVGDPCMTTREFMQQLGFNDQQMDEIMSMADSVGIAH